METQYFAKVPEDLILDTSLSDAAFRLQALLLRRAMKRDTWTTDQERLAADLGRSERSIQRSVAELKRYGLTVRKISNRRGDGFVNEYNVAGLRAYVKNGGTLADRVTTNMAAPGGPVTTNMAAGLTTNLAALSKKQVKQTHEREQRPSADSTPQVGDGRGTCSASKDKGQSKYAPTEAETEAVVSLFLTDDAEADAYDFLAYAGAGGDDSRETMLGVAAMRKHLEQYGQEAVAKMCLLAWARRENPKAPPIPNLGGFVTKALADGYTFNPSDLATLRMLKADAPIAHADEEEWAF